MATEHEFHGKQFDWNGAEGTFLWSDESAAESAETAKNNDSLVLRLKYGNESILLPGEAEKDAQRELMNENEEDALTAAVLKVGHHESKNSTMLEFLTAMKPRTGIVSVGEDNSCGHPSKELLERLEKNGVRILRTDRDGTVQVLTESEQLEIQC